jgi:mono/diheme cytochrome c family protein
MALSLYWNIEMKSPLNARSGLGHLFQALPEWPLARHWPALLLVTTALGGMAPAQAADSAATQIAAWTALARSTQPAFTPSAQRGEAFYGKTFTVTAEMPRCAACHTADPRQNGSHAITGKRILPMAVTHTPERFTDAAKTEKWFKRNCKEVTGAECTPAEKADFVTFLQQAK